MAAPAAAATAAFDCAAYSMVDPVFGTLSMQPLSWIVALAIPSCFALAMVMGANDVGNAFGTSVGSGVLSVRSACAIAAVFDFIGAIALGQGVASTIRKGIVDVHMFDNTPELLMFGNWCAVVGSACWVAIATIFNLPVSSTHAVIGAILGFALVEHGAAGVDWMGVGKIALSWIASPVLAGAIAALLFWTTRTFIMRQETSVAMARSRVFISAVIGFVIFLAVFFVMSDKAEKGTWQAWGFPLISVGVGAVTFLFLLFTPFGVDLLFRKFKPASVREAERQAAKEAADARGSDLGEGSGDVRAPVLMQATDAAKEKSAIEQALMAESTAEFQLDVEDAEAPSTLELFDENVEARFAAVQVLDAAYLSFCHGANDIANVAGPMATIWQIYDTGLTSEKANTPFWILILMGVGIVVGLFFFGYRVIMTMGKSMTTVTPSRGFSMELGTATSVLVASYIKIPVSTTQAAVGSVVAVGLVGGEKGKAVNWRLFTGIIASWVITLPVAGGISALIYWAIRPLVTAVYPH